MPFDDMMPLEQQPDPSVAAELCSLAERVCAGTMTAGHYERLNVLLLDDERSARFYATYLRMHGLLAWHWRDGGEEGAGESGQWPVVSGQCDDYPPSAFHPHPSSFIPHPSSIPPIIVETSPTLHSPLGSFVFSHIAAALILGIGLLIGLAWRISLPSSERQEPGDTGYASVMVGRITALADCKARQWSVASGQWSEITNHQLEIINHKFSLGDRFLVSSGLMEITYDTGAKVLLQGPCTYEIDSDRGGFLAVGLLTAKVEKGSGIGGQGSGKANHKSEIINHKSHYQPSTTIYQLFSVRTPTATVTDLGTEFGVEVEESGSTRSHVFQGSIAVRSSNSRSRTVSDAPMEILRAGQSIRVERSRKGVVTVTREPDQPGKYVRHIPSSFIPHPSSLGHHPSSPAPRPLPPPRMSPKAYAEYVLSLDPVAYYRMEWPVAAKDRLVVLDSSPGGRHGIFWSLDRSVTPYAPGRFGDAMSFRGDGVCDWFAIPDIPIATDGRLTIAAWVKAVGKPEPPIAIVATCWGALRNGGPEPARFTLGADSTFPNDRWQHVAYVVDDASGEMKVRMYLNGKPTEKSFIGDPWPSWTRLNWGIGGMDPVWISRDSAFTHYWRGQIDELAIFNKALSIETIERLHLGGMPAVKGGHQ